MPTNRQPIGIRRDQKFRSGGREEMGEIECHLCGDIFSPSTCVDMNNYDGEVKCPKCGAILHVKLTNGKLQKRKVVDRGNKWMRVLNGDDLVKYMRRLQEDFNKIQAEENKMLEECGQIDNTPPDTKHQNE